MALANKCANGSCSAVRNHDEGKLFRLDIQLADTAGHNELKTMYVWLCPRCARRLNPKVEVSGDTVTVLLTSTRPILLPGFQPRRPLLPPFLN